MRRAVIEKQRRDHGRKALAVLPIHYPKEVLTAMNVLAVELWGPPGPPRSPDVGRIQPYVCSLVRNALAFLASGGCDLVDGVLFPHTCDSIQGLATVAPDFGGWSKASFRYHHPKGEQRPSSRTFVRRELEHFITQIEELTGTSLDQAALRGAIELHKAINALRRRLLESRANVPLDDLALYTLLRRGETLWPEDHRKELEEAVATITDESSQTGVPIMITGYVPEPMSILSTLNDAGAYLVGDDYAAIGRRVVRRPVESASDPLETLTDLSFAAPPCPTRTADQSGRLAYLESLFDEGSARGLIIHTLKFCEPELFDVPAIRKRFAARDVPVLSIEGELERELSGQTVTRLEAFIEMVSTSRRAA